MPGNPYTYSSAFPKDFQVVDSLGQLTPAWQYFLMALWAKTGGGTTTVNNTYTIVETPAGPAISGPGPSNGTSLMGDAPVDGTLYGRKDEDWFHVTHTDIADWTAALAPYALAADYLPLRGGVMTGRLTMVAFSGVNGTPGTVRSLTGSSTGFFRWEIDLGDATAETGSNTGSNFALLSYNDAGTSPITVLGVKRANGQVTIQVPVNAANDAAAATAGVPVGGIYRNGSVLMVRVT